MDIKERNRVAQRRWVENNPEKAKEQNREKQRRWRERHPKENLNNVLQWKEENPEIYRSNCLAGAYRRLDKKYNRGESTITGEWIRENIFTSKCLYCGKDDWTELGCDRIDNDKPHTPDNVVCSCEECNKKRGTKTFEEFLKEIGKLAR